MSNNYPVPAQPREATIEIRKSRFIAVAQPVSTREEAMERLDTLRRHYRDARHYCWAYILGDPGASCDAAMSDDGEPAGTAGKPILNVLQHKGVGDVMVVVIRYFGGIKLGAGGLTRAYSSAAEAVMSALPVQQQEPMLQLRLQMDFSREQALRHWAASHHVETGEVAYSEQVTMTLQLPERLLVALVEFCRLHGIAMHRLQEDDTPVLPTSG